MLFQPTMSQNILNDLWNTLYFIELHYVSYKASSSQRNLQEFSLHRLLNSFSLGDDCSTCQRLIALRANCFCLVSPALLPVYFVLFGCSTWRPSGTSNIWQEICVTSFNNVCLCSYSGVEMWRGGGVDSSQH